MPALATPPLPWQPAALFASPLFVSISPLLGKLPSTHFPAIDDLNRLGAPIAFIAPDNDTLNYELRIRQRGEVATRPNDWHDLFNALAWLTFPHTKSELNRLHCDEQSRQPGPQRSRARDALTLFDESGMIVLCAERELAELLIGFRWKELFWTQRAAVQRAMRFLVFGHALHEKALAPYKGITARALILDAEPALLVAPLEQQLAWADRQVAVWFAQPAALASTQALHPLPILGIPGWSTDNEDQRYYDDTEHFRPGRSRQR